jgi:transketolase
MVPIINAELESQFMIAPSIIAGDMSNLANEVKRCEEGRADYIHLDVMDGAFVPNTTFDHIKIKELRPITVIPFDAHLMINEPVKHVRDYVDAGCDIITVHAEVCNESSFGEIRDILQQNQVGVGLAINPNTELPPWSYKFIADLDQLIVMSVIPGRSGQKYIDSSHEKTQNLIKILNDNKFEGIIEADGGVTLDNVGQCFADGARAFVGGSAIIGQKDVRGIIREFRNAILKTRRKMLIQKANELGGPDLVKKWIELHVVGEKKNHLVQVAKELGFN